MSDFRISLDKANTIISAAFAKGKDAGMKPLSCVVVDAGDRWIGIDSIGIDVAASSTYAVPSAATSLPSLVWRNSVGSRESAARS